MERLVEKSARKINNVSVVFKRYLYHEINKSNRLIAIKGARGTGKTTLLLQLAKEYNSDEVLYVALDDLFFSENTLYSLAEKFVKIGGKVILIDEVHKYPNWSRELKLVYDDFTNLKVIFTSSSILEIYKGESDLSRRAVTYNLAELSFREYLLLYEKIELPILNFQEILKNHKSISLDLVEQFTPFKYFSKYLKIGNYPYFENNEEEYYQKLRNTVNLILEVDLQTTENLDFHTLAKLKRLLFVISSNVPFTPNIQKISDTIQLNRNALVRALQLLDRASLIRMIYKQTRSISLLNKPDKIWLHNTNLMFAISGEHLEIDTIRETFFMQNLAYNHELSLPAKGDVLVDNTYLFEIGGKNKSKKQIAQLENAFVVKDDIEVGFQNSIPLWLFGFLY
ncbi:MAG: ATP-binding protein [Crocinitomicaceae bacterium]|nr:ATP-binding protein [Crocinitomicaceae bacterium]